MKKLLPWAAAFARQALARQYRHANPITNDYYVTEAPSAQQTVDLFKQAWSSKLPIEGVTSGPIPLFDDDRIAWLIDRVGSFDGMSVLELGPLEGAHSTMLAKAGAKSVHAIDANSLAYLKCLVVKELLGLDAVKFELGDFVAYLDACKRRYDLVLASGILYHLLDPLAALLNMTRVADRVFLWTHVVDEIAMPEGDPRRAAMTGGVSVRELDGESMTYHERSYFGSKHTIGFCGGPQSKSVWVSLDEIRALFERRGFRVETAFVTPDHPHGPAACIFASKV